MCAFRRVVALIAAAGQGTRLGAQVPKAYVRLRGRSLLERSVATMIDSQVVDEVIVIVDPAMEDYAHQLLSAANLLDTQVPVRIVHGASERASSVWAGLQAISDSEGVVLIHDAARALTPAGMVGRIAKQVLAGADAVVPVVPVTDTIKQVAPRDVGRKGPKVLAVTATPARASLRAVQTPQGFDLAQLRAANRDYFASSDRDFVATDDASLMEWHGHRVECVDGDALALKITTPIDLVLAEAILAQADAARTPADQP